MDNFLLLPRTLAAGLYDAYFAVAFGMVLSNLWLQPEGDATVRARLRYGARFCAAAMLLAIAAQAYLTTATMIASAAFAEVRGQLWMVLTGTHAGRNVFAAGGLVLVFTLLTMRPQAQGRAHPWLLLAVLIALAAVRSASGHAAADGDFTLAVCVQCIHLISIAVWAGSVVAGGLFVLPTMLRERRTDAMLAFTRRLSRAATLALGLVMLSGSYNAWRGLGGSAKPLAHTGWGVVLDAKIALVLTAVAMGAPQPPHAAHERADAARRRTPQ